MCVHIAVMHTSTCAHLLTRPILSVNLSESRILEEGLISGDLWLYTGFHVCVCSMHSWLHRHVYVCDEKDGSLL